MKEIYKNNAEIVKFLNRAQSKIADLSTLLVERGMDECDSLYLLLELSDFIESLDSCYCDWTEDHILAYIHEYNHRANLNGIPYINFTSFTTVVLIGNNGSINLPITTGDIVDFIPAVNDILSKFPHNNLALIQGGTPTERYHLSKKMYDYLDALVNPKVASTVRLRLSTSMVSWPSGYFELGTSISSIELIGSIEYNSYKQATYFEYKQNGVVVSSRVNNPKPLQQPNRVTATGPITKDKVYSFSALFDDGLKEDLQYIRFRQPMYYGTIKKNTPLANITSKLIQGTKDVRDKGEFNLNFNVPVGNTLINNDTYLCPYVFIPASWGKFTSAINASFDFSTDWIATPVTMPLLDGASENGLFIIYPTQIEGVATFKFNW
jgi:hypothetical protein